VPKLQSKYGTQLSTFVVDEEAERTKESPILCWIITDKVTSFYVIH